MMTDTPDKQETDTTPGLVTPDVAAVMLGLDQVSGEPRRTVLSMARRGDIQSRRVGKFVMIVRASVENFIEKGQG